MPQLSSSSKPNPVPPVPMTPIRTAPLADQDLKLMAPVKKYPSRTGHLADGGGDYWKRQMNNAEPMGDSFLFSLFSSRRKQESVGRDAKDMLPPPYTAEQKVVSASPGLQHNTSPARSGLNAGMNRSRSKPSQQDAEDPLQREVKFLKLRIGRLERAERRLQQQLHLKSELVKDTKVIAEEAQAALIAAEETISDLQASLRSCRGQADRYQGWWLTEYHSLKVVLARLPSHERADFKHIAASSKARFATYCSDL